MGDSTFRNILNGAIPKLDSLLRIANAAEVSVEWLATGKESSRSQSEFEEELALIPGYNVQVAAGHGSFAGDESPTRELPFRRKWLRFRGLKKRIGACIRQSRLHESNDLEQRDSDGGYQ